MSKREGRECREGDALCEGVLVWGDLEEDERD